MKQVLKKEGALEEIQANRDRVELEKQSIRRVVKQMVIDHVSIDSAQTVKQRVFEQAQLEVSKTRVQ